MANTIMLEDGENLAYSKSGVCDNEVDMRYWSGNLCTSGGCCGMGRVPSSGSWSNTAKFLLIFVNQQIVCWNNFCILFMIPIYYNKIIIKENLKWL